MRYAALGLALAMVSCRQAPRATKPAVHPPRMADGGAATLDTPPRRMHDARAPIESPHGGSIEMLAATPDANAVLTVDELGGARLWPTIDGTREPCVVDLPAAKQLVLRRRAEGFTAVALDEGGGLYISTLDDHGRTISHTTHGIDPAYMGLASSTTALLAWRADQHVLQIDDDGVIQGDLGTEPQQQIVDVAVSGDRAVALLDKAGTRQLRWLALQPHLAWGDWLTPPGESVVGVDVALSPDHKHIALTANLVSPSIVPARLMVFEDSGKLVGVSDLRDSVTEVRFADDGLLAVASPQGLSWAVVPTMTVTAPAAPAFAPPNRQKNFLVAGSGHALWPINGELMIVTPTEAKFLGYETLSPRLAQPAPDGGLLVAMGTSFHLLDRTLQATAKPTLGLEERTNTTEMQWLGGADWLLVANTSDGKARVILADSAKDTSVIVRDALPEAPVLGFVAATDVATMSFSSQSQVARVDRKARSLVGLVAAATVKAYEQTVFVALDPAVARGQQLLQVSLRDKVTARWLPEARSLDRVSSTVTFDGVYAAADAAGHVFAWRSSPSKVELAVFLDGKQVGTLPTTGPGTLWPDPKGARVLELGQTTVTLYALDAGGGGKAVWTRDIAGAQDALWLTDGSIALTHGTGIARLDAATGNVSLARCGWGFGLSTKAHPFTPRIEPVCMQLIR